MGIDALACLREQESFVMRMSTIEAAPAVPNPPAPPGSEHRVVPSKAACIGNWERSSRPFSPGDVSPLAWWRTLTADNLGDAQHLLLRATLENICVIKGHKWLAGLHGDAAASIALALGSLPITELTLEVDLAMSALTVSSLGGNAGSVVVLSHILRLAPLDHPFAGELSVSWLVLNLRRALNAKATDVAPGIEIGTRSPVTHRAGLHAGDVS
jgi:hypothetical protein